MHPSISEHARNAINVHTFNLSTISSASPVGTSITGILLKSTPASVISIAADANYSALSDYRVVGFLPLRFFLFFTQNFPKPEIKTSSRGSRYRLMSSSNISIVWCTFCCLSLFQPRLAQGGKKFFCIRACCCLSPFLN